MRAVIGKQKRMRRIPLNAKKKDLRWNMKYVTTKRTENKAQETSLSANS